MATKSLKAPGPNQLNYALRRVIYDSKVAATSLQMHSKKGLVEGAVSVVRIAGLQMARNLGEFFAPKPNKKYDSDIHVSDFGLQSWSLQPHEDLTRHMSRLHKIVGHIVCVDPTPFDGNDFKIIVETQVRVGIRFVEAVLKEKKAEMTENADEYWKALRKTRGLG